MNLNLYIWRGVGVLTQYSNGIAFALAISADHARNLIAGKYEGEQLEPLGYKDYEWVNNDLAFLDKEPEVFTTPAGFYKMGGE